MDKQMRAKRTRWIWHHKVHEAWGKERLYFVRLNFYPTYDFPNIQKGIQSVLYDKAILSYVMYELTGDWDMLLRLWLPTSMSSADFVDSLHKVLMEYRVNQHEVFHVSKVITHWVWDGGRTGAMPTPSDSILRTPPSDDEIQRINDGLITDSDARVFQDRNIIAPWKPGPGVKFLILVPEVRAVSVDAPKALARRVRQILQSAPGVSEISVYIGEGFARLLVMARVEPDKFDTAISKIIGDINNCGVHDFFGIRTYTYVTLNCAEHALHFEDRLPVAAELFGPEEPVMETLLSESESAKLEVKGSAFVDLNRYFLGDGVLEPSDKITNEGVVRAIVGMLNAEGGKIVVGALEASKFAKCAGTLRERLKTLEVFNDYIVCGIEYDYLGKNWDAFLLRLLDIIEARIAPSPSVWLTIKREVFYGKEMCVISVRKPANDWFYFVHDGTTVFYVRQSNRTVELPGPKADQYKRANER
jgi:hypothetical protein